MINQWQLYEMLQRQGDFNRLSEADIVHLIGEMNTDDLKSGIIEFLLILKREKVSNSNGYGYYGNIR